MDTSDPEYILQCEKAEEIQKRPHPNPSLDGWSPNAYAVPRIGRGGDAVWAFTTAGYVWLPRQDQSQEMMALSTPELVYQFSSWYCPFGVIANNYAGQFTSMEQLWLAFVMKEKFRKVWNGEDWVREVK